MQGCSVVLKLPLPVYFIIPEFLQENIPLVWPLET
jgi:hypothetical protein